MTPLEAATWKNDFGFQVSLQSDPDLMSWLLNKWMAGTVNTPEDREAVNSFISFGRHILATQYIVGVEYLDKGIGLVLANGERVPFVDASKDDLSAGKTTTVPKGMSFVSITGGTPSRGHQSKDRVADISVPIT